MAYLSEFRQLFHAASACNSASESAHALRNWLRGNADIMQQLQHHRAFEASFSFPKDDLVSWYALSRVNDLLLPFEIAERTDWSWNISKPSEIEYSNFWKTLGFESFYPTDYHPFWCEIVAVETDENPDFAPQIVEILWEGLNFSDLLFARSGVRVRSGANFMDAKIATTSPLYFSFIRPQRRTIDLSLGWGHNSQWSTDFRRDYVCGEHYLFNVDGAPDFELPLFCHNIDPANLPQRQFFASQKGDNEELTTEEREEILVHRSFIKCIKDSSDLWPYDDCLVVRRDLML